VTSQADASSRDAIVLRQWQAIRKSAVPGLNLNDC
jgi:hypothetical protein